MKDITIKQKDREELLRLINIMHTSLSKARDLFDLELSDLKNFDELQWKLFHALQLAHNDDDKDRWSHQFILREEKKNGKWTNIKKDRRE